MAQYVETQTRMIYHRTHNLPSAPLLNAHQCAAQAENNHHGYGDTAQSFTAAIVACSTNSNNALFVLQATIAAVKAWKRGYRVAGDGSWLKVWDRALDHAWN